MTERTIATFTPQAWVRDGAIEVDPEGPGSWDASAYAAQHEDYVTKLRNNPFASDVDDEILDNDDVFHADPAAPEWVREWKGPFSIRLRFVRPVISKTTFTFTVLHRTDEPIEDLEEAIARSFDGHAVGLETGSTTETVPNERVRAELVLLHNDGEFFDIDLGIDADENDPPTNNDNPERAS